MTASEREAASATLLARHFGDANHDAHRPTGAFDFYCVAHGEDYSPKYMGGVVCHNGFGEGLCADECNRCPVPCPIEPCPIPEDAR